MNCPCTLQREKEEKDRKKQEARRKEEEEKKREIEEKREVERQKREKILEQRKKRFYSQMKTERQYYGAEPAGIIRLDLTKASATKVTHNYHCVTQCIVVIIVAVEIDDNNNNICLAQSYNLHYFI